MSLAVKDGLFGEIGLICEIASDLGTRERIEMSMTTSEAAPPLCRYRVFMPLTPGASVPKGTPLMRFAQFSLSELMLLTTEHDGKALVK